MNTQPDVTRDDIPAILTDTAIVFLFALIGRASHAESLAVGEVFHTGLPFWAGLLVGHVIVRLIKRAPRSMGWGTFVWASAWVLGHLGRLMLGQTSEPAFLVVSAVFLALGLLGWRLVILLVGRARRQSPPRGE